MPKPVQDTIEFTLTAEQTIVNETVRITASISGMIYSSRTSEADFKQAISDMMKKFINTDWQFSKMQRSRHATGGEQVTLIATARVPESENYQLHKRAEEVSTEGLRIQSVDADTSPTTEQLEKAYSELRLKLITMAREEQAAIKKATGEHYRLGKIIMLDQANQTASNRPTNRMAAMASTSADVNAGGTLGSAVKLTQSASVTLRVSR